MHVEALSLIQFHKHLSANWIGVTASKCITLLLVNCVLIHVKFIFCRMYKVADVNFCLIKAYYYYYYYYY